MANSSASLLRFALGLVIPAAVCACAGGGSGVSPVPQSNQPAAGSAAAPSFTVGSNPATFHEFAIAGDTSPRAITVAQDGNAWFLSLNHVNRIDTNGNVASFVGEMATQGFGPAIATYSPQNDITIGPDKAVWFTANGSGVDVNPFGCNHVVLARIAANAPPGATAKVLSCVGNREHGDLFQGGVVSGPGGNLWTIGQNSNSLGSDGSQYQVVTTSGTTVLRRDFPAPCEIFASAAEYSANGIARGPDNAVYVAAGSPCAGTGVPEASSVVIRIDASGNVTNIFPVPDATRIAEGPDGNLWVTQAGTTNAVARVTPGGSVTEFPVPTANAQPLGIAAGNDGAVWFAEFGANKLGRITTSGVMTEYPVPTANSGPFGVASLAGACGPGHGSIWFTESSVNKVARIDF